MDMDTRILEINEMIEILGLADAAGEAGGLRARYDAEKQLIVIGDHDFLEYFDADVGDEELRAFLQAFLDDE